MTIVNRSMPQELSLTEMAAATGGLSRVIRREERSASPITAAASHSERGAKVPSGRAA